MSAKKIISIIGLMGAGKSTVGYRLAQKLKYNFVDSDREIETTYNRSITNIFNQFGEKYFREIEEKIILEIINKNNKIVLSLGGGAFINNNIRKVIIENSITIWLHASIEETMRRIGNKTNRPLLNDVNKLETLKNLQELRYPIYQLADYNFDTTNFPFEDIINNIYNQVTDKINF